MPPSNLHPFRPTGRCPAGYRAYEDLIAAASDREPEQQVAPADPWTLMYTSGTTGKPKGVIRSHRAAALLSLVTEIELGLAPRATARCWSCRCATPTRSTSSAPSPIAARRPPSTRARASTPSTALRTLAESGSTFTSLVPTHYIMMLGLPAAVRARHDFGRVTKLMISSAPARQDTKRAVMEMFPQLRPVRALRLERGRLGHHAPPARAVHQARLGRARVRRLARRSGILDENGDEVPDGEPGELYSCNPYTFDGYWKLPEKTAEAFRGDYCTVGDMARRDEDGYIHLVDRKSNMIISGGENIYPSEVEAVLGGHPGGQGRGGDRPARRQVGRAGACRRGAAATAHASSEAELLDWCRDTHRRLQAPALLLASSRDEEMPRTATGKILHRVLKTRLTTAEKGG